MLGGVKFFAVLGMDKDIITSAIQKEHDYKDVHKSIEYLEKIVQVTSLHASSCICHQESTRPVRICIRMRS